MQIKTENGKLIDIFAIYWTDSETLFLGLPRNYGGLLAYNSNKVCIANYDINFKTVYFENNIKSVLHWALIKEKLLDDLLELDEDAYNRFLEIIKSEGLVDPDFY